MSPVIIWEEVFPTEETESAKALSQRGLAWMVEGPAEIQRWGLESPQGVGGDIRVTENVYVVIGAMDFSFIEMVSY